MPPENTNPWVSDLLHDDGSLQPTGIAIVERDKWGYYLWLTFKANAEFGEGPEPGAILYGFDPRAGASASAELLGVWSLPE
jgi:hypothetical protein